jgi:uncharacterized membrane protein
MDASPAVFDAVLQPHRSLSPRGFRVLMTVVCVVFSAVGLAFFLLGAWPVSGFCGLEILLIYGLFRLNFRSLTRYETIRLTDTELELRRVAPDGSAERITLPPNWLKVVIEESPGRSSRLILTSHGHSVDVGGFLAPDERVALADALNEALRRLRIGNTGNHA